MPLHADNTSAIQIVSNPSFHEGTKHIEVDHHSICEDLDNNIITLPHVYLELQIACVFTKALSHAQHQFLMHRIAATRLEWFDKLPYILECRCTIMYQSLKIRLGPIKGIHAPQTLQKNFTFFWDSIDIPSTLDLLNSPSLEPTFTITSRERYKIGKRVILLVSLLPEHKP